MPVGVNCPIRGVVAVRKAIGRLHPALGRRHTCCRIVPSIGHTAAAICKAHHAHSIRHANEKVACGCSKRVGKAAVLGCCGSR